jgi:hypothetical protein
MREQVIDNASDFGCVGATEHNTGLRKVLDPKVSNHLSF